MKNLYVRFVAVLLITSGIITTGKLYAQNFDEDLNEHHAVRRPATWPEQVITHQVLTMGAPHVVNFRELAAYEMVHPRPPKTGLIEQIEDKDKDWKFIPHNIPQGTPVFNPDDLLPHRENGPQHQAEAPSPAPLGYWDATTGNGSLIPPDVDGAAGPSYVLVTNNQQYDIYNKSGVLQMTLQIGTFFGSTNGSSTSYFDPHVLYDPNYQRFILVSDGNISGSNDGGLFIGISETSDPTGNWYTYSIDNGDANQNDLLDYPELGYNNNWVVITGNDFVGNNVTGDIYVFNRDSLYNGLYGSAITTYHLFTDNNAFSWGPAQTYGTSEDTLWMVQDGNGATGAMQIGCISGTASVPKYNAGGNISVTNTWNENAVDVSQKGSTELINDDDTRVGNGSFYLNGQLWFTHTIFLPATGTATYSGVDWYEVSPSSMTLKQYGRVVGTNADTNYYYPSINVNSNGDALLGYCISGADVYPSAAYSFHAASDAVNYMETPYVYKAGTNYYYETLGGGRNRYGDFTGVSVDPNDQSFWGYDEYPVNTTTWGIVVAHVGPSIPPTNPPVASFVANDTALDCSGLVQFTDLSTNDPTSWLWNFGDGTTSTVQNPTHQYTTNGTFTVTLKATNTYGTGTSTITSYITVSLPAAPTAANVTHCGASTFSLSASTTNNVAWFDSAGTQVSSSNPFVTPVLNTTTTYWVQDTVASPVDSVGPATYTTLGTGGIFTATNSHYLSFDALNNFTLISVVVDAQGAGSRTIEVVNSSGTTIATASPNIPAGVSTVTLNFNIPAGTGYELTVPNGTAVNLYRNNGGASNSSLDYYPFTIPNVVSITGSDAGNGYYYYFYDWKVQGQGCVSAQTAVTAIVGGGSLSIVPNNITNVACYGQATGSITLTTTGGTPNYTYDWSNGQTTNPAVNLAAGTYHVTVTDAGGCSSTASETVGQPASALTATATATNASCYGSTNGGVNLTPAGGTATYTYNWTGGITTQNLSNVAAGTYTVTVTDANHCTATASATVGQPAQIVLTPSSTNAGCGSSSTGSASVSATGGSGSFSYHWNTGATTATINNLSGGTYTVVVTDVNSSCTASASAVVNNSGSLVVTTNPTDVTCYGLSNGSASVSETGGTGNITYTWSVAGSGNTVNNLPAGTYTVTVSDAVGCTSVATQTITQPDSISISLFASPAACGTSNGSVNATVTGGTVGSGYLYHWNTGATTAAIGGLAGGTYTVTVTDANTCTAQKSAVVTSNSSLVANLIAGNATCHGEANGTASATVTSGTSPFQYHWNTGGQTSSISGLAAGTYYVTITDSLGCQSSDSVTVDQPTAITIIFNVSQPTCNGQSTGSASLTASGGASNYTYNWSTGSTSGSVTGLAPGAYTVTVQDGSGCTATSSLTINTVSSVVANTTEVGDLCYGGQDGSAQATATGGSGVYTYSWSNGDTTPDITGLTSGTYNLTISDNAGCSTTTSVNVTQPTQLTVTPTSTSATNGQSNGSASVAVSGGTVPYSVIWSNSQSGSTIQNLAPGIYIATVTDGNGCEATAIDTVLNITGIWNITGGVNFAIYPNPARTQVMVQIPDMNGQVDIRLTDVLGQTMYIKAASSTVTVIDLSGYASGIYFVEVTEGNIRSTQKLVIDK